MVDAPGKFLIPGLWDMHVHWYDERSLPLFTIEGVTGIRIMFGFPLHLDWQRRFAQGKLSGPRLVVAGPAVDGVPAVWPDSIRASTELEGRHAVQAVRQAGYDWVKLYHLLPREAYFGISDEAKRQGLAFGGHVPISITAAEASDAGQKTIEHLYGVALACSSRELELRRELKSQTTSAGVPDIALSLRFEVAAHDSYDDQKAAALFSRFVKNGTWQVPTLTVRQSHALLNGENPTRTFRMQYMPPSLRARWESRRRRNLQEAGAAGVRQFQAVVSFPSGIGGSHAPRRRGILGRNGYRSP